MRIVELILDGFKSYPQRTSISGWDSSFNAITGLNGSGKSNILDSICFVLGITNLQVVRAQNLVDLIYKRGQAGITRASVTIVFDNSDKSNSPLGYESLNEVSVTRQIALNGTSKYLVCGHRATQQNVQNLFQSVGLNINNPNFVIMQGKITKVLNMSPKEILSLIEEASGTSMFESQKDKAVKTMARKEKRLQEIEELLKEEITPKLDRLREEKRAYLEFQKKTSELEKLSRLVVAWDWTSLRSKAAKTEASVAAQMTAAREQDDLRQRLGKEIARMEKDVAEITKKRDKELAKGGKVQLLETKQKEVAMGVAKLKAQVEIASAATGEEQGRIEDLSKANADVQSQRDAKLKASKELDKTFKTLKATFDAAVAALSSDENLLQTLLTGISSSDKEGGEGGGFMGQLSAAQASLSQAKMTVEKSEARVKHMAKELKEKEPLARKAEKDGTGLVKELEVARAEVAALDKELSSKGASGWTAEKEDELRKRRDKAEKEVRELSDQRDAIKSRLASLDFDYSDPVKNFDRSTVKGLVASLIAVDEANFGATTALEVCAGGRLYNVVVANEVVGSQLLDKGQLKKRVTMIPLNKISSFVASAQKLAAVKTISHGKAQLALSMIGYEDEVEKAMAYVFGNTLIAADKETANAVTFHNDIKMKTVTMEGDVYDPSGTLSGGSRPKTAGVLIAVQELREIETKLQKAREERQAVEKEWETAKGAIKLWKDLKGKSEIKKHQVALLEQRMKESSATRIIGEVDTLKASMATEKEAIAAASTRQQEAQAEVARIKKEMEEFKNNRGSKLEELKAGVAKKKKTVQSLTAEVKHLQREVQTAALELEQLDKDLVAAGEEVGEAQKALGKAEEKLAAFEREVEASAKELKSIEAKIAEETRMLVAFQDELDALDKAIKGKQDELADCDVKEKELEHEIERLKRENKGVAESLKKLEAQFKWISDESHAFGQEGTQYAFANVNMNDIKRQCAKLEEEKDGMKKKVNPKVLTMIEGVEKKEKDLLTMHRTVIKDKSKIEETVSKLDDYKRDALHKTWEVVNGHFGNIFADLLPGNFANLQPPEDMDITDGLEVKVRLGTVWKASLTELSGGQRSLIALSLIMSLLHFKPAPMYILDEVDAALDLSHTENIGRLFRTRFKGSQFIVVSLKDGLFTNANVLFRAKFRDGTSVVERTAQRSASALYDGEKENESSSRTGGGKKKASSAGAMTARRSVV